MIHPSRSPFPKDLLSGLSQAALASSLQYLENEILYGDSSIGEAALYAYKLYSKAVSLEQYARDTKIKKLSHKEFQDMVDPVAQSIWGQTPCTSFCKMINGHPAVIDMFNARTLKLHRANLYQYGTN